MHSRFRVVLVWVWVASALAWPMTAQTPPQSPAKAPAAAPTRPAPPPAPTLVPLSASQKAAAQELFASMKMQESLPAMSAAMVDSEVARNPGMVPYRDIMLGWLRKYMTWDAMLPELSRAYADAYTESEMKELAAFYKTPAGQKVLNKSAELAQKTAMLGAKLAQSHGQELSAQLSARREELQKAQEKAQGASGTKPSGTPSAKKAVPPSPSPKKP